MDRVRVGQIVGRIERVEFSGQTEAVEVERSPSQCQEFIQQKEERDEH